MPLLEDFKTWLAQTSSKLSISRRPSAICTRAICRALARYLDDGSFEINNKAAGDAIRPRSRPKEYLFAGSDPGGERAAGVSSLIGTAKLSGIDRDVWSRNVLTRAADHPINRIADLLPRDSSPDTRRIAYFTGRLRP